MHNVSNRHLRHVMICFFCLLHKHLADDARVKTTRGPCHDAAVFYMGVEILTMLWLMWLASPTNSSTNYATMPNPHVSRGSCGSPPLLLTYATILLYKWS